MRGRKLLALALTLVLAGAMIAPATYAAEVGEPPLPSDGEVGEPPLPGDDDEKDDEEDKVVDYDALFEEAKASIEALDRLEALDAAIKAVNEQIPDWNVWKNVPCAAPQVHGYFDYKVAGDNTSCVFGLGGVRGTGKEMVIARIFDINIDEDYDKILENKDAKALLDAPVPKVVEAAKASPKYESDQDFANLVNVLEENYEAGMKALQEALIATAPDTKNIDKMTAEELIAAVKALPTYAVYSGEADGTFTGLFSAYSNAMYYLSEYSKKDLDNTATKNLAEHYANLVVAATKINPDFKVDLSGVTRIVELPDAPATGTMQDKELSATIAKIAVTAVAGVAAVAGVIAVAKRYVFSPLKRK